MRIDDFRERYVRLVESRSLDLETARRILQKILEKLYKDSGEKPEK